MTPEAQQLRAKNNLASLPEADQESVSWMLNAGADDTKREIERLDLSKRSVRILEVAIDCEAAGSNRTSRIKMMAGALSRIQKELAKQQAGTVEVLAPETMLGGEPSRALSPMEAGSLALVENGWQEARRLADLAKNFSRSATAAKALCGITLGHLREHYFGPRSVGRPKKIPNDSGFSSWREMLADRVGITDDTATNWMRMGEAVATLADRESLNLREIITKLPWDWTMMEATVLESAVQQITEGRSQKELLAMQTDFMADLGVEPRERPNSSNNPTGRNGSELRKAPPKSPQALLAERQEAARLTILGTVTPGRAEKGSVAMFMEHFVATAGAELEALPQAELRDLYEHTVKPFAAVFRKLAGL